MLDLQLLTKEVRRIAKEAGCFIRDERKKFNRECVIEKNSHDYVSYVDKESEKLIISELKKLLPQAGFLAEEGSGSYTSEEYCWVIDPLDGTTNFIHDNAPYCVSIALRNRQELLIGVVYEICRDECYWSFKGSKSYLGDTELHVTSISKMNDAVFIIGLPYNFKVYKPMVSKLVDMYGNVSSLRMMGAAAAELCYVAAGRFEGRVEAQLKPWDVAAGALILMNAGGKITDFKGGDGFYSGQEVLASNGLLHQQLMDVVNK